MTIAALVIGLIMLLGGGEILVRGAVAVARAMRVSPLFIGVAVVGFGTSMPELITSLNAAFLESPGVAIGNIVGSNIANILLILGVSAAIYPLACDQKALRRDGSIVLLATAGFMLMALTGHIGRMMGAGLMAALVLYLWWSYRSERLDADTDDADQDDLIPKLPQTHFGGWIFLAIGIGLLVGGSYLLVMAAVTIARAVGVTDTVIGLTIVAVGTSLPELTTSVVAAIRRQSAIAFGNVLGSNIFNLLGILGVVTLVHPLAVPPRIIQFDIWVLALVTMVMILFARTAARLSRAEGWTLLAGYVAYTVFLYWRVVDLGPPATALP